MYKNAARSGIAQVRHEEEMEKAEPYGGVQRLSRRLAWYCPLLLLFCIDEPKRLSARGPGSGQSGARAESGRSLLPLLFYFIILF